MVDVSFRFVFLASTCTALLLGCGDAANSGGDGGSIGGGDVGGDSGAGGSGGAGGASGGTASAGGNGVGGDPAVGTNRVFVTSMKYVGDFGGLTGGDALCQTRAASASMGGTWMAWLGDGVDGPATRFAQSAEPYNLLSGDSIAQNWDDLIDGTIEVPIDRDENGTTLPADDDMVVWTAVFHTGGNPTPVNCMGWSDADAGIVPTGLASATDTGWTVTAPYACSELHRLYCFEQ
jgi:hypothetical protein